MASLYVTSVTPGAGKTAVAAGLVALLSSRGAKATFVKPVVITRPGVQAGTMDPDVAFCREVCPSGPGEPLTASAADVQGGLGKLKATAHEWLGRAAGAGTLVIEGITVTEGTATASADLAEAANAKVIGVVRYRRLMDLDKVKALRGLFGARLLGVVLNAVPEKSLRAAGEEVSPELKQANIPVLAIIPEDRMLLGFTVAEYQARLGGRLVNSDGEAKRIVESLLVGANILDQGDLYYSRVPNKALITRGGRPDLQTSALTSSTRCLILTEGVDPIPYIRDRAIEACVPIMVVPKGTLETVSAIEGFVASPTFYHPDKLARFAELLNANLVKGALGI